MRRWWIANGGPLALVVVGVGIGGFTSREIGLALIVLGLAGFALTSLRWRCIKFTVSRCSYRVRTSFGHGITGSLEAVVIPGTATSSRDLRFTTDTQTKRFIDTGEDNPSPVGLRFQLPSEQIVTHTPTDFRTCGRLILRVEELHEHGLVVGAQLPGIEIAAEVSYRGRKAKADEKQVVVSSDSSADIVLEILDEERFEAWGTNVYIVESPVRITTRKRMRFNGLIVASPDSTGQRVRGYGTAAGGRATREAIRIPSLP